ncbi:MAG: DUF2652 domain-containing protein [Acidimicrobiia bacterium]
MTSSSGLLLIADLTGYTTYLHDSELEHARGTLTALLEILVGGTRPPLTISRLEGDAVFSYGLEDFSLRGQTVLEMIEGMYVAFRRAIDLMVMNTLCTCNACANIGNLDLKFFVHHGEFLTQDVGAYRDLVGTDVNVVHRLTKNTVVATAGVTAYALWTETAIAATGLGPMAAGWIPHVETYDDVGAVSCRIQDLHTVWAAATDRQVVDVDGVFADLSIDIAAPREVVWDRLADPAFRTVLFGSERQEVEDPVGGRTAPSSTFVCYHGGAMDRLGVGRHLIVEWLPFERVVIRETFPMPGAPVYELQAFELSETETGTQLRRRCGSLSGPAFKQLMARAFVRMLRKQMDDGLRRFKEAVETSVTEVSTAGR